MNLKKVSITTLCILVTLAGAFFVYLTLHPYYFSEKLWDQWKCKVEEKNGIKHMYCNSPEEFKGRVIPKSVDRTIPNIKNNQYEIILMGDSFLWGTGLDDKSHAGAFLEKIKHKKTMAIALPGGTTSLMLTRLKKIAETGYQKNVETIVYLYRDHHNARNVGRGRWGFHLANTFYTFEKGSLVSQGSFKEAHNLKDKHGLNKIAAFFEFLKMARQPEESRDEDVFLTAQLIRELKNLSEQKFKAKFYLVFYPEHELPMVRRKQKLLMLLPNDLATVDIKTDIHTMGFNPHPDTVGAEQLAKEIASGLK